MEAVKTTQLQKDTEGIRSLLVAPGKASANHTTWICTLGVQLGKYA